MTEQLKPKPTPTLTPDQIKYARQVMGISPVGGNPYHYERGHDVIQNYENYEAHETFAERSRDVRFDDLYSDRELGLWADLQHYKARAENLEIEIREACKILNADSLVVAVRALALAYRELKSKQDKQ